MNTYAIRLAAEQDGPGSHARYWAGARRRDSLHPSSRNRSADRATRGRENSGNFGNKSALMTKMRRPSLTRAMVDSLEAAIVKLRASLASETDADEAARLLNAINYIRQTIDYKKSTDPAFKDAGDLH